jgi:hypothetical protein
MTEPFLALPLTQADEHAGDCSDRTRRDDPVDPRPVVPAPA